MTNGRRGKDVAAVWAPLSEKARHEGQHPDCLVCAPIRAAAAAVPAPAAPTARPMIPVAIYRKCPECGRIFNVMDPEDAAEFYYGHDCEEQEEED